MTSADSVRHEGDTWDLASSVGATATLVATTRAMATRADQPLINDPFAEPLVRAVGVDVLTRLAAGELDAADLDTDGVSAGMQRMVDSIAVRTKFFDEFFLEATQSGIRQAVILASGLDARAYRLHWPSQTTVYEIDQPQVIEFKTHVLAELGATPTAYRRTVAIDLREDWPAALRAAGFDPHQPTAWSAEGLLGYLPPQAQDHLLDTVTELSAPGSRLAAESTHTNDPAEEERHQERMRNMADQWRKHDFDLDLTNLVYFGDRTTATSHLCAQGWEITATSIGDLFAANGFLPSVDDEHLFAYQLYISGTLAI
ncbi:MAG: class I SAM-dependent methyltransferase [Mycobacteriaceae bacterium]|nr:class I SAM-dependent methyltransferase [Mycobacteriaceae bacterium]